MGCNLPGPQFGRPPSHPPGTTIGRDSDGTIGDTVTVEVKEAAKIKFGAAEPFHSHCEKHDPVAWLDVV